MSTPQNGHLPAPRHVAAVVVGAGPAGLAAALLLHRHRVPVLVLDENPREGGQIFRQLPASIVAGAQVVSEPPSHQRGHHLLQQVASAGIEIDRGVVVFDAGPGFLRIDRQGRSERITFDRLVVAAGAIERSVPFPGWTLPGVITAGAAQVLVRGYLVRPGLRAVVSGTGPLLLPTITSLLAAGVQVVGAFDAAPRFAALAALPAILGNRQRRREAVFYLRKLWRHSVRLKPGHAVVAAEGERELQAVHVARLDRDGAPVGPTRRISCDLLCTGFGLEPATELPRLLGCAMVENPVRGGFVPVHDQDLQTSVRSIYVAGETAGIGGAEVAMAEGELAGLAIAHSLGVKVEAHDLERARRTRARERRAADALLACFPVRKGLLSLAHDDTLVCRCEDVTLQQAREAADLFGDDLRSLKLCTRAGMGACQGRICQSILSDLLEHRFGSTRKRTCPVAQAPLKPVSIESFCDGV